MKVIYDRAQNQLVCYRKDINNSFWENHWRNTDISSLYKSLSKYNLLRRITKKYLSPQDGLILEGGCGIGQFVYSLSQAGYECIGIDTAEETVAKIKSLYPALNVTVMDVRKLDFPDNYFAGYWSIGVIEHFLEGYDDILNEMFRVVKPGGYMFVRVPVMSFLRRLKAFFGLYETISSNNNENISKVYFYQFIFSHKKIINDFAKKELELVEMRNKGGIKGSGDEIPMLKAALQYIAQLRNKNLVFKSFVKLLDIILSPITGHTCLFVFKKAK